ncbi:MAG: AAA family ATPase [Rubrivivax sp.]
MAVRSCLVLGVGSGAGQTLVTAALVAGLCRRGIKAVAMQPVARGERNAAGRWHSGELQRLASAGAFELPARVLCTAMQSSGEPGEPPALDAVVDTFRVLATWADAVVVDARQPGSTALAHALGLPVVLVVALREGCADESRRALAALHDEGLECAGWIGNHVEGDGGSWLAALRRGLPAPCLGEIPTLPADPQLQAGQAPDLPDVLDALAA